MSVTINASTSSGLIQTADTSGTVEIQSNGTTKLTIASTGVSGTLVQGTAVASTSGTSIDFTSIPSWVKRITVMFKGVSTNGTSRYLVQGGVSGTPTTSGYLSATSVISTGVSTTTSTAGFIIDLAAATTVIHGGLVISLQDLATNSWVAYGTFSQSDTARTVILAGSVALSGTLNLVRITTVNGTDTFDAGSINIQYEG